MGEVDPVRSASARAAVLQRWAHTPPAQRSRDARAAFRRRFERVVDPEGLLDPAERAVCVDTAIRAYTARLTHQRLRKAAERRQAS